ncbi:MAG: valine--tRNA ligase, partial [Clostridia bacterium]|nr:valine--tRNA ligase [Clostridia bacterium]
MKKELAKQYSPAELEDRLYSFWNDKGYFTPDVNDGKPAFTIVIPPPNVTGQLHMGHALDETLQDVLIRYKRMQGYSALWLPGTDHAGIATQIKVEEQLRKNEGLTRYDLGREKFLERVWDWKNQYGSRIINQLKKLGSSCDWTRERFTMDPGCSRAVKKVFVNLYNDGIIYRGNRIINWCPHCRTALSDAEVEYAEQNGNFWHIRYPILDENGSYTMSDSDGFVEVATTRPETMLGDTAVAVNPDDERYAHLIGKQLYLPLVGRKIPVIADDYVEKDFGTGCVKITPAHDPNDFLVGQRHNLPQIVIMDGDAKISCPDTPYHGMDRYEARKAIVADLNAENFLVKVVPHAHNVGTCYRCGTTVEPLTSNQWFVKMEPLAGPALDVVAKGDIRFVPERFTNNYNRWMENVHDWCISRQLWWGHRIPAYYCDACGKMEVSEEELTTCPHCGAPVRADEDVLDTWFSSALWPFTTLGWPEKTAELEKYYPTNVLVTGYDIISFWVSRMIFSGLTHTGKAPFSTVFIHGLVRDAQGRKMSKSLGNGIDPLEIIDQYGADALRFALTTGNAPGSDMRFSDEKIEAARNFNNKIWNAARFVLMNLDIEEASLPATEELEVEDRWILSKLNTLIGEVTSNLDRFELGIALSKLYDFLWDVFCDWYIELVKPRLNDKGSASNKVAQNVLCYVLSRTLELLHPYLPFITEEIWQTLPHVGKSIMVTNWPKASDALSFPAEEKQMEMLIATIRAIRNRRAEMNVPPSKKAALFIVTEHTDVYSPKTAKFFEKLASAASVTVCRSHEDDTAVQIVTDSATFFIPLAEIIDLDKEAARLSAEIEKLKGEIARIEKKLSNPGFVAKAPEAVVSGEKEKMKKY